MKSLSFYLRINLSILARFSSTISAAFSSFRYKAAFSFSTGTGRSYCLTGFIICPFTFVTSLSFCSWSDSSIVRFSSSIRFLTRSTDSSVSCCKVFRTTLRFPFGSFFAFSFFFGCCSSYCSFSIFLSSPSGSKSLANSES